MVCRLKIFIQREWYRYVRTCGCTWEPGNALSQNYIWWLPCKLQCSSLDSSLDLCVKELGHIQNILFRNVSLMSLFLVHIVLLFFLCRSFLYHKVGRKHLLTLSENMLWEKRWEHQIRITRGSWYLRGLVSCTKNKAYLHKFGVNGIHSQIESRWRYWTI